MISGFFGEFYEFLWEFEKMWLFFRAQSLVFTNYIYPINSLQFSHSVVSDSLQPHGLQHARLPCPSPTPRACSNSSSRWCHPTISSSGVPFSSHLQSFPASGSFPMSRFFASGGQCFGVSASASVLSVTIQDWFPLGWIGWLSLLSKGLSRVFSKTGIGYPLQYSWISLVAQMIKNLPKT